MNGTGAYEKDRVAVTLSVDGVAVFRHFPLFAVFVVNHHR